MCVCVCVCVFVCPCVFLCVFPELSRAFQDILTEDIASSVYGQNGVHGDTALKSYVLLACGAHKKGCPNGTFRAAFPSVLVFGDPQTLQNKRKTQNHKSSLFYPPQGLNGQDSIFLMCKRVHLVGYWQSKRHHDIASSAENALKNTSVLAEIITEFQGRKNHDSRRRDRI